MTQKRFRTAFFAGMILLSVLATVKIWFVSLGVDEEYAVAMAYRITTADRMFLEMWEPHQTSGFLCAFLIRIFVGITGTVDGLVLYLRILGSVLQAAVSFFLYATFRKKYGKETAFTAACFYYNTLPKWIQTPEFAGMFVSFGVLFFLCMYRFDRAADEKKGKAFWLVAGGISYACLVLSYPSALLVFPLVLAAVFAGRKKKGTAKSTGIFLLTCGAAGVLYVAYFLSHMRGAELVQGMIQMTTDGSHNASLRDRLLSYAGDLAQLLPYLCGILVPALAIALLFPYFRLRERFCALLLSLSLLEQLAVWLGQSRFIHFPLLYYGVLYVVGLLLAVVQRERKPCFREARAELKTKAWTEDEKEPGAERQETKPETEQAEKQETEQTVKLEPEQEERQEEKQRLLRTGLIPGGCFFLCGLILTNTTVSVTACYLMPGLLCGILLLGDMLTKGVQIAAKKRQSIVGLVTFACLLLTVLFAKGFLVCSNDGVKDNVLFTRQKALTGPAKNIYCKYVDGYAYNVYADLIEKYTDEEKKVLYVGEHPLYYLLGNQEICNYSTISTPTFDERLLEYWEKYPYKTPELIICNTTPGVWEKAREYLGELTLLEEVPLLEGQEPVRIYERK